MQPEQTHFVFDFGSYEQRLAANALIQITAKEGWHNLTEFTYTHENGKVDPLPLGIPHSWELLDKTPHEGIFEGKYNCAPEDRAYKLRSQLLRIYSLWTAPEQASQVMWWSVLTETPEDVLEYVFFLFPRFPDVTAAFKFIDGEDGNGLITLREFEDGMRRMNCRKFRGEDEKQRIGAVYRYLDPHGEGNISEATWAFLDLLFKEIRLSVREFVKFLVRSFGEDLANAWSIFDSDGSGEIDWGEWTTMLNTIGFFGASKAIFSFLDKDGEGTISVDEFDTLSEFEDEATSFTFDKEAATDKMKYKRLQRLEGQTSLGLRRQSSLRTSMTGDVTKGDEKKGAVPYDPRNALRRQSSAASLIISPKGRIRRSLIHHVNSTLSIL